MDEFDLYRVFFNSGEEQLYAYLENLCDYLYDDLHPRILLVLTFAVQQKLALFYDSHDHLSYGQVLSGYKCHH